jgi:hypothetical protein
MIKLPGDNAKNVKEDDSTQSRPLEPVARALNSLDTDWIIVTFPLSEKNGVGASILTDESSRLALESLISTVFAVVESVRKTGSLMNNSDDCSPQENQLLEIVGFFSAMSQEFHILICNSSNTLNDFASTSPDHSIFESRAM